MAYTKAGPFVTGGPPAINAVFLNNLETDLVSKDTAIAAANTAAATAQTAATGINPASAENKLTSVYNVDAYGAAGDGATDDRAAIQAAIDAAANAYALSSRFVQQVVFVPQRQYRVGVVNYLNDDGSAGGGVVGLMMRTGVHLTGYGQIVLANNSAGSSGTHLAIIRSSNNGIHDATISNITLDGNSGAQPSGMTQGSNIEIIAGNNVQVLNTKHYHCCGNGIYIAGKSSTAVATNIRVAGNFLDGGTSIGIEVGQFDGIEIDNNTVANYTNNGIDIYGENGTTTSSGTHFRITNNRVTHCLSGIFPETVAQGIVANNVLISNTEAGVHVNRVNGAPTGVVIQNNLCNGGPIGITVTGDMYPGSVIVRGNTLTNNTTAGINMGGGGASLSGISIADNYIDPAIANSVPLVLVATGTNVWSNTRIRRTMTQNTNHAYDVVSYATTTGATVSYDQSNT